MNKFKINFLQDYDLLFTKDELISLVIPKYVEKYKIYERKKILSRLLKGSFEIFMSLLGLTVVAHEVKFSLEPPYMEWSLIIFLHGLLYLIILMPVASMYYDKYVSKKTIKIWRLVFLVTGLFYFVPAVIPKMDLVKEAMRDKEEILMLSAMTEQDQEKYLKDKQEKAAKKAFREENIEAKINSITQEEQVQRAKEVAADKSALRDSLKQREKDIEIENKRQREFYSDYAAPKLLYKCKGSDVETALVARIGNINRLLDEASDKCIKGYEIIKRKD